MAARHEADWNWCGLIGCLFLAALIGGAVFVTVFFATSKGPAYSVTVAGVAGLDPAVDLSAARPTLSPVFNLSIRVDNSRNRMSTECISGLSTVAVSYEGEVLAHGVVPQFCSKEMKARERSARAWGQDLAVPRFLRDQLAGELAVGEAYVDVKVTTPADCYMCSDTVLVCSKAKIGGGPTLCRKESVYRPAEPAAATSTSTNDAGLN